MNRSVLSPSVAGEIEDGHGVLKNREHVPELQTHAIRSKHVAQTFKIQVMQPVQVVGESRRFAVLYATDGNLAFDVLKGIAYSLQLFDPAAPRFIIVGIGYPGDHPQTGARLRTRDFTFPRYPKMSAAALPIDGVLMAEQGTKDFCGAEDFQDFLEDELIPFIDGRYATATGERTYFGHSSGAGFGLFTLFTKSHLFNSYILSSPGLSFDGESSAGVVYQNYDFALEEVRRFIASGPSLPDVHLYMSVGSEEEFEPNYRHWRLTSSFYRMASLLKEAAIPGLRLSTEVLDGATHMAAWPIAFIRGVQAIFGASVLPADSVGITPCGLATIAPTSAHRVRPK